jgi:phage terminase large subunit-like protein
VTPVWSTACPDWEQRVIEGRSLIPFPPLFPEVSEEALEVFRELRVKDLPGAPRMGRISRPWVIDFVSAIFGACDPESGRRLISEFFLLISKKNTKSTTAAGIMLTALVRNWRESAEFLILAPTLEVANNAFFPVRDMVRGDPDLDAMLHVQDFHRTVTHRLNGSTLKVVAADNESVGGKKATGVLVDELWLFGKKPNAENMLREATGGLASRPEGFVIYLSTQSDEPPAGIFSQKLLYARGVRDGEIHDPAFLPVLYEFPTSLLKERKERDPAFFYVTNPNLGASVDEQFLVRELGKAEIAGPGSVRGFLAKHLNIEIGVALMGENWAGAEFWEKSDVVGGLTLEQLLERCEVATIGVDGGGLDDLLGLVVLGRERDPVTVRDDNGEPVQRQRWLAWGRAWAHPIVLERHKQIAARLRDLEASGDLVIVNNVGQDVDELADLVEQVYESGLLERDDDEHPEAIGVDPHGVADIVAAIVERKVPKEAIIGISQGWKMVGAVKTAERRLAEGTLLHAGQPIMAWCVGNARVEPRGNAIIITKQASGSAKIDLLMALFDAVSLMSMLPELDHSPPEIISLM